MAKAVDITPDIANQIRLSVGDPELDVSSLVVYETVLASTEPLQKHGGVFEGARIRAGTLQDMASKVNAEGGSVPIHTLHQSSTELPVGRVFQAETVNRPDGQLELRGYFYLPKMQTELIASIDQSVIDSVSVGMLSQSMKCSECGWDYMCDDASMMHFLARTCENGHTIGKDGAHLQIEGLESWFETSLVSQGAVGTAKIASRARQMMGPQEVERLAATGMMPEAKTVIATVTEEIGPMDNNSKNGGAEQDLASLGSQIAQLSASAATAQNKVSELEAQLQQQRDRVKELEAQVPDKDVFSAELGVDKETAKTLFSQFDAALKEMQEQAKAALVATGSSDPTPPEDIAKCVQVIQNAGVKLHQLVGNSGNGQDAATGDGNQPKGLSRAYMTRR